MPRYVYAFGQTEVPPLDKNLLGGKGKGLAEMASIGLPVPPGFIISTEACNAYRQQHQFPEGLQEAILSSIKELETKTGQQFGKSVNPLLVSVRSGARVSMPGMMDTILNLGLNDDTVVGFAEVTKNERLAYDNYRRLIMMYGDIVKGISRRQFDKVFEMLKDEEHVSLDIELSVDSLKRACQVFKEIYEKHTGSPFPQDTNIQLFEAVQAVFNSWDSERATLYRHIHKLPNDWGTAVTVQEMVFGNKNNRSATGVGFTRNPADGNNIFYGEFLLNAQGEEVVAGTRTPHPINQNQKELTQSNLSSLEELLPKAYQELHAIVKQLEQHYQDMQDIEFTIDDGKLFMLQTRTGKRTGFAAIRMAVEMMDEHLIDEKTALKRIHPDQIIQLLSPIFDQKTKLKESDKMVAKGLNAGPGAASGKAVFSKEKAIQLKEKGIPSILIREETNPDDFPGMVAAEGILTIRGGSTSHAAVVARGMGKPCIVGCGSLNIDEEAKSLTCSGLTIFEEDPISIDGMTGEVFFCSLPTSPSEILQVVLMKTKSPEESLLYRQFQKLMSLADKYRKLSVRTNADTPTDCLVALAFGAEGVGLCRTEHMFMDVERLNDVRCMFFSMDPEERKKAIDRLLPHQKKDFIEIFRVMNGLPVTIRLLDPPLHEFMPHTDNELHALATIMKIPAAKLEDIRSSLEEVNPMLGHRGCRLGISYPELTEMQSRAIFEAAIEVSNEGLDVHPEIMVPLVGIPEELEHQKMLIEKTAAQVFKEKGKSISYTIGTMIELPRAALLADKIAKEAEFFSFGTNDLTQTTFGFSRDDSGKFIPLYIQGIKNPLIENDLIQILKEDPFQVIDREGVGELMRIAVQKGRSTRPNLKCGICGEHGGDASSVAFCQEIGLDYVSCSPYRIPVARLAAAQTCL